MQAPPKEKWQEKIKRSRYLFGAILFHVILFVLLATWVIWQAPPPPPTDEFHGVAVKIPPPPVQPPSSGAAANNPHFEPQPVVVPVVTPPSVITTVNSSFTVDAPKIMEQTLSHISSNAAQGTGLASGSGGSGSGTGNGFGSSTGTSDLLEGNLYDLKQTREGKPTNMDPGKYHQVLAQFVQGNWSPAILDQYYKASKPLFTPFIFIPTIHADDGPKAFGVEKEVQPLMYVVWYKVTAAPPQDGTYHFVGIADDILAVRVNGKTVLDGSLSPLDNDLRQSEKTYAINNYEPGRLNDAGNPNGANLYVGRAFHATAGQPVDIDVIIGEEPGGSSNYFLFMQREESTYKNQSNGTPLLPIFQLGQNPAKPEGDSSGYPAYSHNTEPWGAAAKQ